MYYQIYRQYWLFTITTLCTCTRSYNVPGRWFKKVFVKSFEFSLSSVVTCYVRSLFGKFSKDFNNLCTYSMISTCQLQVTPLTLPILLLHINIRFYSLPFASFYSFIPIEIIAIHNKVLLTYCITQRWTRREFKINNWEMLLYFKSIQWYQINVRGNRTGSAQRHGGGASAMAFSGIDVTPTQQISCIKNQHGDDTTMYLILIQRKETQW